MTVEELREKEDKIKTLIDRTWDSQDRDIAYAYLHRGYGIRIVNCEKTLARALFEAGNDETRHK